MKNYLRIERNHKGLTQIELAELVNVSRQSIISIESNRYMPSILLSLKIAKALGKRVEDLFELEESD
ncbi:helix-turn-helix transcriptional regulator [Dyadobacter sp. CY347]|uniref:helix-turn-helix transcriptional regulator n=1 Tax=Dyadobacter sp. CY347 TaxID=2909336 RepID=UPI001F4686D4|nr:helix-turn-helix transcriptional regulator [Dyadobacter sp. CY347]MCF2488097.1 helix-turn-helix transcriptional regulator [Dyadobacter sp. CY347]